MSALVSPSGPEEPQVQVQSPGADCNSILLHCEKQNGALRSAANDSNDNVKEEVVIRGGGEAQEAPNGEDGAVSCEDVSVQLSAGDGGVDHSSKDGNTAVLESPSTGQRGTIPVVARDVVQSQQDCPDDNKQQNDKWQDNSSRITTMDNTTGKTSAASSQSSKTMMDNTQQTKTKSALEYNTTTTDSTKAKSSLDSNKSSLAASRTKKVKDEQNSKAQLCRSEPSSVGQTPPCSSSQPRRFSEVTPEENRHHQGYRKLSIQPRTSQYEPSALLQMRSAESGRTALEELIIEHGCRGRLVPRYEQYERSALMARTAAGVTELDLVLAEVSSTSRAPMSKAVSVDSTGSTNSRRQMLLRQQSMPERPPLLPRSSQYEEHGLLQHKDDSGVSMLDAFLREKEREIEEEEENSSISSKGKCSEKCTCKNAVCSVCKPHQALVKKESSRETVIEPRSGSKRVHFSEGDTAGGEENEDEAEEDRRGKEGARGGRRCSSPPPPGVAAGGQEDKTKAARAKAKAKHRCVLS